MCEGTLQESWNNSLSEILKLAHLPPHCSSCPNSNYSPLPQAPFLSSKHPASRGLIRVVFLKILEEDKGSDCAKQTSQSLTFLPKEKKNSCIEIFLLINVTCVYLKEKKSHSTVTYKEGERMQ